MPIVTTSLMVEWLAYLRAAGRPATTLGLREYQLGRFLAAHPEPLSVTQSQLIQWLAEQDWRPETRRSFRSALRSFYSWAQSVGYATHNPAALLPVIRASHHSARPTPEVALAEALLGADRRVTLMLLLAARQGLRRGEIARIHSRDVTRELGGWSLRVHGKGERDRVVPLLAQVAELLQLLPAGWAFPGRVDGHLSARRVGELLADALPGEWTAHTLRHRFATAAYRGSRDLLAVQELLGHSKPETTRLYVQLPDDALRAALAHVA